MGPLRWTFSTNVEASVSRLFRRRDMPRSAIAARSPLLPKNRQWTPEKGGANAIPSALFQYPLTTASDESRKRAVAETRSMWGTVADRGRVAPATSTQSFRCPNGSREWVFDAARKHGSLACCRSARTTRCRLGDSTTRRLDDPAAPTARAWADLKIAILTAHGCQPTLVALPTSSTPCREQVREQAAAPLTLPKPRVSTRIDTRESFSHFRARCLTGVRGSRSLRSRTDP